MFKSVQQVGQQYLFGMMVIMLILGLQTVSGFGLLALITLSFLVFWLVILAIIPYAEPLSELPFLYYILL
jgi:predicted PurR-regulated permease PerM